MAPTYPRYEIVGYNDTISDFKAVKVSDNNELLTYDSTTHAAVVVIDGYHDVPTADTADNNQMRDVIGNKNDSAGHGSLMGYAKVNYNNIVVVSGQCTTIDGKVDTIDTEVGVIDGYHDVPSADSVDNNQMRDVIGQKNDSASGDSLYSYAVINANNILVVAGYHAVPSADSAANSYIRDVLGNKTDTTSGNSVVSLIKTVDSVVDAILVDTGTTLPATLSTIDGNVDEIKNATRVEIDNMNDNQGNWVGSEDAVVDGTAETGAANCVGELNSMKLSIDVSGTASNYGFWANSSLSVDLSGCSVAGMWLKMPPSLDNYNVFIIDLGGDSSNRAKWWFARNVLNPGWNYLILDLNNPDLTAGTGWTPTTTVAYSRFSHYYDAAKGDFDTYVDEFHAFKSDSGPLKHMKKLIPRLEVTKGLQSLGEGQTETFVGPIECYSDGDNTVYTVPTGKVFYLSYLAWRKEDTSTARLFLLKRSGTILLPFNCTFSAHWNGTAIAAYFNISCQWTDFSQPIKFTAGQTVQVNNAAGLDMKVYLQGWLEAA